jgi:hypothetical protein
MGEEPKFLERLSLAKQSAGSYFTLNAKRSPPNVIA